MEKSEIIKKYGINPDRLDEILQELSIIKVDLPENRITVKDSKALDLIAGAKPEISGQWDQNPFTGARRYIAGKKPQVQMITFVLSDGSRITLSDPQAIEYIRQAVEVLAANKPAENPANRPQSEGRKVLRSIVNELMKLSDGKNPNQRMLFAGYLLSDVGYLMNPEQWENNPGNYISHDEYILSKVKNAIR